MDFPLILTVLARVFSILKLLRFQLLLVLLGAALAFVPAIHDAWYAAADQKGLPLVWSLTGITVAALLVAFMNWYTARILLKYGLPNFPGVVDLTQQGTNWATRHLPRVLGTAVLFVIGVSALSLGIWWEFRTLIVYGVLVLLLMALCYWMLVKRRDWLKQAAIETEMATTQTKQATLGTLWNEWSPLERWLGKATAIIVLAILVVGMARPAWIVTLGAQLNVVGIVLLAALLIAPVGSLIAYLSNYTRVPCFTLLLIWVIACSLNNENHDVRTCTGDCDAPTASRSSSTLSTYARDWIRTSQEKRGKRIPVVIVASEGGGVRAAYWTALVLEYLERRTLAADANRPFSQSVFAISGVSGGAVGAGIFAGRMDSIASGKGCGDLDASFRHDALSPTVSTLFFTDLPKHLQPLSWGRDRAATLELEWEKAFCGMAQPLDVLSPGDGTRLRPLLLLNSTAVKSGRRVVVSSLEYGSQAAFDTHFPEALDGAQILGTRALPASAATLTSARFPFVSPAGVAGRQGEESVVRLVDGGYFDNTGAATARDVISLLRREYGGARDDVQLDVGVLIIRNDPTQVGPKSQVVEGETVTTCAEHHPPFEESPSTVIPEVLSPVRGFFSAWSKGSDDLRRALLDDVRVQAGSRTRVFQIALFDLREKDCFGPSPRLPLSWLLSSQSVNAMHAQLDPKFKLDDRAGFPVPEWAYKANQKEIDELLRFLAAD